MVTKTADGSSKTNGDAPEDTLIDGLFAIADAIGHLGNGYIELARSVDNHSDAVRELAKATGDDYGDPVGGTFGTLNND